MEGKNTKILYSLNQPKSAHYSRPRVKREVNENNKDAIIASLKRKIKKLEEDNTELRKQLKFAYAEVYKKV